jgi:hypothetical protein
MCAANTETQNVSPERARFALGFGHTAPSHALPRPCPLARGAGDRADSVRVVGAGFAVLLSWSGPPVNALMTRDLGADVSAECKNVTV